MRAWYTTVEKVMRAADIKASAYLTSEIGDAIESASQAVDELVQLGDATRPAFAPWEGSITFDWPIQNNSSAYMFWLNQFKLAEINTVTSGGNSIGSSVYGWPASGGPFSALCVDTATTAALDQGPTGTGQRSLVIGGTWGTLGRDEARSAWTLGASVAESATSALIYAPIGIGSLVLAGDERMIVTGRAWAASGQTASALAAQVSAQAITVTDTSAFLAGEEILIDSERMLIRDVSTGTLIVQRASSGTTLAAHSAGGAISWARTCLIERGALGTSAESHSAGAAISIYRPPALVEQLTIAYAIDRRAQESAGYARTIGQGEGERQVSARGIADLERRVLAAYGRIRHRAV